MEVALSNLEQADVEGAVVVQVGWVADGEQVDLEAN